MKTVIVLALLAVVGALATAGVFMLRGGSRGDDKGAGMARSLAWRVGLSVALFLLVLLAHQLGWIRPTGLPLG